MPSPGGLTLARGRSTAPSEILDGSGFGQVGTSKVSKVRNFKTFYFQLREKHLGSNLHLTSSPCSLKCRAHPKGAARHLLRNCPTATSYYDYSLALIVRFRQRLYP